MEHRDPSRPAPADPPRLDDEPPASATAPRAPSKRFARLVESPAVRRLAVDRLARALLALAAVAGLVVVGGSSLSRSVVAWLHRQKDYETRFADIVLEPPPPPWIKGGRPALLEAIRDGRANLQTFSILDLDLDKLLTDVRRNPWVARADRASKLYPDRVTVALAYREPVALVRAGAATPAPVDREGVVLPAEGLDLAKAGPLATIAAEPPAEPPRPGLAWPDGEPGEKARPRARVVRAARLAGQIKDALRDVGPTAWRPERVEILVHEPDQPGFWVEFDRTPVLWGLRATLDAPGEPTDLDKWRSLVARAAADGGLKPLAPDEYLDARDSLRVRKVPRAPER